VIEKRSTADVSRCREGLVSGPAQLPRSSEISNCRLNEVADVRGGGRSYPFLPPCAFSIAPLLSRKSWLNMRESTRASSQSSQRRVNEFGHARSDLRDSNGSCSLPARQLMHCHSATRQSSRNRPVRLAFSIFRKIAVALAREGGDSNAIEMCFAPLFDRMLRATIRN